LVFSVVIPMPRGEERLRAKGVFSRRFESHPMSRGIRTCGFIP
jgi:hypothetical protein